MIAVEVENRSGARIDEHAAATLARETLAAEGVEEGDLGLAFVGADEMRALKREHLGIDEPTDVLSFPIDGREPLAEGVPRQLGDAIVEGEHHRMARKPASTSSMHASVGSWGIEKLTRSANPA